MTDLIFHEYDTVESTNDIALKMAREGVPDGTVVMAKSQTRGKGRLGRIWLDEFGLSALLSIIVSSKGLDETALFALAAGLAVSEILDERCAAITLIKWPNDVMYGARKVAGILVETTQTNTALTAVVGIGLNILQMSFPDEIADTATSLLLATGKPHDPVILGQVIAARFMEERRVLAQQGAQRLAQRCTNRMWGVGRMARIDTEGTTVIGHLLGIDEIGCLLVREDSGTIRAFYQADSIALLDEV